MPGTRRPGATKQAHATAAVAMQPTAPMFSDEFRDERITIRIESLRNADDDTPNSITNASRRQEGGQPTRNATSIDRPNKVH